MAEEIEVKKRKRRVKVVPDYIVDYSSGTDATRRETVGFNIVGRLDRCDLLFSAYSRFIPVAYLSYGGPMDRASAPFVDSDFSNNHEYGSQSRLAVNKYVFFNKIASFLPRREGSTYRVSYDRIYDGLTVNHPWYSKFTSRGYICETGKHALLLNQGSLIEPKNRPVAIMCVPRENLVKVKLDIILTGAFSVADCVYLIDKEIDSTSYPVAPMRRLFRETVGRYLSETKMLYAKVPLEYIMENCFLKDVSPQSTNIFERIKEIEDLKAAYIDSLKRYVKGGNISNELSEVQQFEPLLGIVRRASDEGSTITFSGGYTTGTESDSLATSSEAFVVNTDTYTWSVDPSVLAASPMPYIVAGVDPVNEQVASVNPQETEAAF